MKSKLVIEDNTIYEVDEECRAKKWNYETKYRTEKNKTSKQDIQADRKKDDSWI